MRADEGPRQLKVTFELVPGGAYKAETTMPLDGEHAEEFAEFCDLQLKFIAMYKTGTASEYHRSKSKGQAQ